MLLGSSILYLAMILLLFEIECIASRRRGDRIPLKQKDFPFFLIVWPYCLVPVISEKEITEKLPYLLRCIVIVLFHIIIWGVNRFSTTAGLIILAVIVLWLATFKLLRIICYREDKDEVIQG